MPSKRSQSTWVEIQDPPQWVRNAADEWFADSRLRSQNPVLYLNDAAYDYRVLVEGTGGPLRWHYFQRQKVSRSRISRGNLVAKVVVILILLIVAVTWGGDPASSVKMLIAGPAGAPDGDSISPTPEDLETGLKTSNYPYILRGMPGSIRFDAYKGVNDYLSTQYPVSFNDERDYWLQFVDDGVQDRYLKQLAENIRAAETVPEGQVRAAISMVQKIPYIDYPFDTPAKYPYHVLYHQNGDCDEKSLLLAYLLRELGYGVAVFHFREEQHMAAGIRAPARYCYRETGYAFIEATRPTIPTYAEGEYGGVGRLTSDPYVIVIADGDSFEGIWREHADAAEWSRIQGMGSELDQYTYGRYRNLAQWYGMAY